MLLFIAFVSRCSTNSFSELINISSQEYIRIHYFFYSIQFLRTPRCFLVDRSVSDEWKVLIGSYVNWIVKIEGKTWNVIIIATCSCKSSGRKYLRRWLLCKILFSTILFYVVTNFLLLNQFLDIRYIFIIYIRYIFDIFLRSRASMDNVFPHFVATTLKNKISQVVSICMYLVRIFHIADRTSLN